MARRKVWVVAAVCGAMCAVCIALYSQSLEREYADQRDRALERFGGEQVGICVASRDILPGETLDQTNTAVKPWLADLLPEDAVASLSDLESAIASVPIYQGEPVVKRRTGAVEQRSVEVPEGLAAVSVPAQDVSAVGGSVAPGTRVDVYATSQAGADAIARGVLVLATSASIAGEGASSQLSWITLAVEPSFVEELIAASRRTDLYFSISNATAASIGADASAGAGALAGADASDVAADGPSGGNAVEDSGIEGGKGDGAPYPAVS